MATLWLKSGQSFTIGKKIYNILKILEKIYILKIYIGKIKYILYVCICI